MLCFGAALGAKAVAAEALQLMSGGAYSEAEARLDAASTDDALAARVLIELAERRGDYEKAASVARLLLLRYQTGALQGAQDLSQAAYAAWRLERWKQANDIYIEASQNEPAPLSLFVDWGNLYLEKYNPGEAESIFRDALRSAVLEGGRWTRGHANLGLAKALMDQGKQGAPLALSQAVQDPGSSLALAAFQANLALQKEDWTKAAELIQGGLEANPGYLPLLRLECGAAYLQEKLEEFESARDRLFAINPKDSKLYEWLGDSEVRRRRLDQAIEHYDEALRLNERNWSALASKGINLLRMGREEEGIESLERAYEYDPYNIWTVNTLRLVDSFEDFERFSTDHFSVRLHRDEARALRPYVEELLERCLEELESRYEHEVEDRVVFEMYPDHEDFAVRTLGLPGLGALGATFGKVVAMDSPSARAPGEFHWASTLWHELGHVVTLSLSGDRVPRWFTEGLSMMEERSAGEGWGDGLSIPFVRAYEGGELLPLTDLNAGFSRPESAAQLRTSYYQAGWLCDVLLREFGMVKIREMLVAYGEDKTTDEVFEVVLGSTVDEVDDLFQKEVARVLDPLRIRLAEPEATSKDLDSLRAAVNGNPENYFLNFALGRQLVASELTDEAELYLQKAIELFPSSAGLNSPYGSLVEIYRNNGQVDAEIRVLRDWWARAPMFIGNALRLSELLVQQGEDGEAVRILEEAMYVDPFSREAHTLLGDRYLSAGYAQKAVREFSVVLALDPPNPAEAHYQLASALNQSGARDAAKRQVLLALERAPGWEEAQRLLLELVRQ